PPSVLDPPQAARLRITAAAMPALMRRAGRVRSVECMLVSFSAVLGEGHGVGLTGVVRVGTRIPQRQCRQKRRCTQGKVSPTSPNSELNCGTAPRRPQRPTHDTEAPLRPLRQPSAQARRPLCRPLNSGPPVRFAQLRHEPPSCPHPACSPPAIRPHSHGSYLHQEFLSVKAKTSFSAMINIVNIHAHSLMFRRT